MSNRMPDPDFIRRVLPLGRAYARYFSPEVSGLENLPASGPVLVIGNHCGLYWMPDAWITGMSLVEHREAGEPSYGLAHDLLFRVPVLAEALRRAGIRPASHDAAEAGLKDGGAVLVYPGGDWEICRPWSERNRVDFGGRDGYIRLALRAGVPVVPVVTHGSHDTLIVLGRGADTAALLGLDRLRVKVFPYILGFPFGVTPVLPQLPLPAKVHVSFLPPLDWSLEPGDPDDDSRVAAHYAATERVMQAELDRLRTQCPNPIAAGVGSLLAGIASKLR
ncbi:MAG: acyltransferase family protein [Mycobacteriaceae bacterium]|nr:acyltransferase family protein [Mycobacteriaceae bacterium]